MRLSWLSSALLLPLFLILFIIVETTQSGDLLTGPFWADRGIYFLVSQVLFSVISPLTSAFGPQPFTSFLLSASLFFLGCVC